MAGIAGQCRLCIVMMERVGNRRQSCSAGLDSATAADSASIVDGAFAASGRNFLI